MRIKSFFADSVEEAIEKARADIGPEAMLMNSKQTDFELRALGSVEVVFSVPSENSSGVAAGHAGAVPEAHAGRKTLPEHRPAQHASVSPRYLDRELLELRQQIEAVKRTVQRQQRSNAPRTGNHSWMVENLFTRLTASGLSEELAQEIAESVDMQGFSWTKPGSVVLRDPGVDPMESVEMALSAELDRRFLVNTGLEGNGSVKAALFVGPPGAGKTTSLIKLALRVGLQSRIPVHILSLDTLRVGGWETLASYARIAGIAFDPVYSLGALPAVLAQLTPKKLVFIDTPGFGPAEETDLRELERCIDRTEALQVQLVIPATMRASVLKGTLERFQGLRPAGLILTRADEVESLGALLDVSICSKVPLAYLSNGQSIPEDMETPAKGDLLARFLSRPACATKEFAA